MCKLVQKIKHSATSEWSVQKFKKVAKRGPQSLSPPTDNKYRLNPLHALIFGTFNHSAIDMRLILDISKKKAWKGKSSNSTSKITQKETKTKKNTTGKRPISPFCHEFYEVRHNNDDSSHIYKGQLS